MAGFVLDCFVSDPFGIVQSERRFVSETMADVGVDRFWFKGEKIEALIDILLWIIYASTLEISINYDGKFYL